MGINIGGEVGEERNYGRFDDRASNLSGIGLFSLFFFAVMLSKIKVEYDLVLASVDEQGFYSRMNLQKKKTQKINDFSWKYFLVIKTE